MESTPVTHDREPEFQALRGVRVLRYRLAVSVEHSADIL